MGKGVELKIDKQQEVPSEGDSPYQRQIESKAEKSVGGQFQRTW